MSAPTLPKSAPPNNWLSTSLAGSTLTASPTKYNQLSANALNVTLIGGSTEEAVLAMGRAARRRRNSCGNSSAYRTFSSLIYTASDSFQITLLNLLLVLLAPLLGRL